MSEAQFLEHINSNRKTIYHLINIYVQNVEEREDLKQEIIFQAWKSKDSFRYQSSFNTWLYKLSLFTIITAKKKQSKMVLVDLKDAHSIENEENTKNDQAELLYKQMTQLDYLSRTILTMHLDGFSNPEIADFIGITINNLNVKLHRIKEKIINSLKEQIHGTR
jgi:RNA polymerase sigma-70 factor (ECF subfamily)